MANSYHHWLNRRNVNFDVVKSGFAKEKREDKSTFTKAKLSEKVLLKYGFGEITIPIACHWYFSRNS